ncbi:hypothetical protein FKM82_027869 [Ascaphus truei]
MRESRHAARESRDTASVSRRTARESSRTNKPSSKVPKPNAEAECDKKREAENPQHMETEADRLLHEGIATGVRYITNIS